VRVVFIVVALAAAFVLLLLLLVSPSLFAWSFLSGAECDVKDEKHG
jgi:hypothetical protein